MRIDPSVFWYRKSWHPIAMLLLPFSLLFGIGTAIRRGLFKISLLKTSHFPIPVVVVGNIVIGGAGKTPFVIWLANYLEAQGFHPGIVSRGFGGKRRTSSYWVKPGDSAVQVGDEAVLLKRNTTCPLVVNTNRVRAVRDLLQHSQCDIVISDDGLQHYRLGRDVEIAMVDGVRQFGNQLLLPAGPLRESQKRLKKVDFVIVNGGDTGDTFRMTLEPGPCVLLINPLQRRKLTEFPEKRVHAVAAIGHPERFFMVLKQAGFEIIPHVFPDHYAYQPHDLEFNDALPILMTEKDAVKCIGFANDRCWYLPVTARINVEFEQELLSKLTILGVCDEREERVARHFRGIVGTVQHSNISE